jgi:hypothetical protein
MAERLSCDSEITSNESGPTHNRETKSFEGFRGLEKGGLEQLSYRNKKHTNERKKTICKEKNREKIPRQRTHYTQLVSYPSQ